MAHAKVLKRGRSFKRVRRSNVLRLHCTQDASLQIMTAIAIGRQKMFASYASPCMELINLTSFVTRRYLLYTKSAVLQCTRSTYRSLDYTMSHIRHNLSQSSAPAFASIKSMRLEFVSCRISQVAIQQLQSLRVRKLAYVLVHGSLDP